MASITAPDIPIVELLIAYSIYHHGHLQRPTEYWALFKLYRGYIPSIAITNERLPKYRTRASHPDDGTVLVSHKSGHVQVNRAEYKYCPNCGQYKRRDRRHWHRNAASPDGYYSLCAECKNAAETARMRQKRATA